MKFVIQRVTEASATVDNKVVGSIETGFLVLVGISHDDTQEIADKMIKKLVGMRIFSDENDKINLDLSQVNGSLLLVSQFTLYANCKKGNRPSFTDAGAPQDAEKLFNYIVNQCNVFVSHVETGIFGADMKISLLNDGPFTILLDSEML